MENNRLAYLSIIHSELEHLTGCLDESIAEADDGEPSSVVDSKSHAITELEEVIDQLLSLKEKLRKTPLSKLKTEYNLE